MVQIVVRHICVTEAVDRYGMGQANRLADFSVGLECAGMATATIGESGRTADVFVLPFDGSILLLDSELG